MLEDLKEVAIGIVRAICVIALIIVMLFLIIAIPATAFALTYKFISLIF